MSYLDMRFLIPEQVADIIFGPNGSNVERLHMEYRAVVNISTSSTSEKVLTVGGMEILPVCKLLQDLLTTVTAAGFDMYGCECENDLSLLVDESQIDALTNHEQLQLLVEETGARVDVFPMCCPQSTDRIVRVCGMPVNVAHCIFGLHSLLQQCPIDYSSARHHYNPNNADASAAADYGGYTSDYFVGAYSSDSALTGAGSDSAPVILTKHYSLPENTESGATVSIDDSGSFQCTITISGTQEQINNARLLLRMCIGYFCIRVE